MSPDPMAAPMSLDPKVAMPSGLDPEAAPMRPDGCRRASPCSHTDRPVLPCALLPVFASWLASCPCYQSGKKGRRCFGPTPTAAPRRSPCRALARLLRRPRQQRTKTAEDALLPLLCHAVAGPPSPWGANCLHRASGSVLASRLTWRRRHGGGGRVASAPAVGRARAAAGVATPPVPPPDGRLPPPPPASQWCVKHAHLALLPRIALC